MEELPRVMVFKSRTGPWWTYTCDGCQLVNYLPTQTAAFISAERHAANSHTLVSKYQPVMATVSQNEISEDCWCGFDHAFMDFDDDGQLYDVRDFPPIPIEGEQ